MVGFHYPLAGIPPAVHSPGIILSLKKTYVLIIEIRLSGHVKYRLLDIQGK
jgi:hypothetical protein